jgi:hypothetical protein
MTEEEVLAEHIIAPEIFGVVLARGVLEDD